MMYNIMRKDALIYDSDRSAILMKTRHRAPGDLIKTLK